MRTAKEMREFAARYNAVHDFVSSVKLENCPFEDIEAALLPDERVCFCFGALHEKAVAATTVRLLQAETRSPTYDQTGELRSYSYDHITSVFSGNMLLHIRVNDTGEDLIYGNLAIERIREAAEIIGDVVNTFKTKELPGTAADELRKYKELLDMGAISQEEFDIKKKQLLAL